jgi:hypothetical protein
MKNKILFFLVTLLATGGSLCAQQVLAISPAGGVQASIDQNGWHNFKVTLTQNVTAFQFVGVPPPSQGTVTVIFTQNAIGGFTASFVPWTAPSGQIISIANPCSVTTTASVTTLCQFEFDGTSSTWIGFNGGGGGGGGGANQSLSNLSSPTSFNQALIPGTYGQAVGSATFPVYLYSSGISFLGTPFEFQSGPGSSCPSPSNGNTTAWGFPCADGVSADWDGSAMRTTAHMGGTSSSFAPGQIAWVGNPYYDLVGDPNFTWSTATGTFNAVGGVNADSEVVVGATGQNGVEMLGNSVGNKVGLVALETGGVADVFADTDIFITPKHGGVSGAIKFGGDLDISSSLWVSKTAPTITGHFNTSGDSISAPSGTAAFTITIGTGAAGSTGTIGLPTATTGWNCPAPNNMNRGAYIQQTGSSTTSATFTNYGTTPGTPVNWTASDVLHVSCFAY